MGRVTLPDHENMSTRSPLRVRGTPAQRQVWQEVGAECGMTETAFARTSLLILLAFPLLTAAHLPRFAVQAISFFFAQGAATVANFSLQRWLIFRPTQAPVKASGAAVVD